ncbi:MAG: hypothetical protein II453_05855 [Alphaproteobacteria bacterium]|nr:hypothetical protein [Alphaproteobacteria bacterium]
MKQSGRVYKGALKNRLIPSHRKHPIALPLQAVIKAPKDPSEKNCTINIAEI